MAEPIITGIESKVERGGYRSRLILDKNANSKDIEALIKLLQSRGLKAKPTYYNTQDVTSFNEQTGATLGSTYETIALFVEKADGSSLTGKTSNPAELDPELTEAITKAGFIDAEKVSMKQKAATWIKPEQNAAKKALKDLLAKGTPQEKYKKAMALYAIGDITGTTNGALINKEIGDAGFAALAGVATALGYAGNELEEAKTLAEKLCDRVETPSSWELGVDYTGKPSKELATPKTALKGAVQTYGKDVFNIANLSSFFPLLQAGLNQDKSIPKILASVLGIIQWSIISFIPQKGQKGLIDAEDFTESFGIKNNLDKLKQNGNSPLLKLWDTIREDPSKVSGRLGVIRNIAMMGVTVWDWTVSPTKMRNIEHKYMVQDGPSETKGFWKTLKDTSSKLFGWISKRGEPVTDAARFHKVDASGKVEKYWWQMAEEELASHIESLKNKTGIESNKLTEFLEDVKSYQQKQRLVKGGLGNLMMISSYALANQILSDTGSKESVNLPELYSHMAIDALAIKEGNERSGFVMDKAEQLAVQPEIREHKAFTGLTEAERASKIYNNILHTAGRIIGDNRISHMFKGTTGQEPLATVTNLEKEGKGLAEKALQIPAQVLENLTPKRDGLPLAV